MRQLVLGCLLLLGAPLLGALGSGEPAAASAAAAGDELWQVCGGRGLWAGWGLAWAAPKAVHGRLRQMSGSHNTVEGMVTLQLPHVPGVEASAGRPGQEAPRPPSSEGSGLGVYDPSRCRQGLAALAPASQKPAKKGCGPHARCRAGAPAWVVHIHPSGVRPAVFPLLFGTRAPGFPLRCLRLLGPYTSQPRPVEGWAPPAPGAQR